MIYSSVSFPFKEFMYDNAFLNCLKLFNVWYPKVGFNNLIHSIRISLKPPYQFTPFYRGERQRQRRRLQRRQWQRQKNQ